MHNRSYNQSQDRQQNGVAIYLFASYHTEDPEAECDRQRTAINQWLDIRETALGMGCISRLRYEYTDKNFAKYSERPAFQQMLSDARAGLINEVVFDPSFPALDLLELVPACTSNGASLIVAAVEPMVFSPSRKQLDRLDLENRKSLAATLDLVADILAAVIACDCNTGAAHYGHYN